MFKDVIWIVVSKEGQVIASSFYYQSKQECQEAINRLAEGTSKYLEPYGLFAAK